MVVAFNAQQTLDQLRPLILANGHRPAREIGEVLVNLTSWELLQVLTAWFRPQEPSSLWMLAESLRMAAEGQDSESS